MITVSLIMEQITQLVQMITLLISTMHMEVTSQDKINIITLTRVSK
jgi:hypothetical protein